MIDKLLFGLWVFGAHVAVNGQKLGQAIMRWSIRQRNKRK